MKLLRGRILQSIVNFLSAIFFFFDIYNNYLFETLF